MPRRPRLKVSSSRCRPPASLEPCDPSQAGSHSIPHRHAGNRFTLPESVALRVSFARPAEVHEVAAIVVWSDEETEPEGRRRRRYGLQWYDASSSCVLRVRHLAGHAEGGHTPPMGTPAPVSA